MMPRNLASLSRSASSTRCLSSTSRRAPSYSRARSSASAHFPARVHKNVRCPSSWQRSGGQISPRPPIQRSPIRSGTATCTPFQVGVCGGDIPFGLGQDQPPLPDGVRERGGGVYGELAPRVRQGGGYADDLGGVQGGAVLGQQDDQAHTRREHRQGGLEDHVRHLRLRQCAAQGGADLKELLGPLEVLPLGLLRQIPLPFSLLALRHVMEEDGDAVCTGVDAGLEPEVRGGETFLDLDRDQFGQGAVTGKVEGLPDVAGNSVQ